MQVKCQQLHQSTEMNTVNSAFYLANWMKWTVRFWRFPFDSVATFREQQSLFPPQHKKESESLWSCDSFRSGRYYGSNCSEKDPKQLYKKGKTSSLRYSTQQTRRCQNYHYLNIFFFPSASFDSECQRSLVLVQAVTSLCTGDLFHAAFLSLK